LKIDPPQKRDLKRGKINLKPTIKVFPRNPKEGPTKHLSLEGSSKSL